MPRHRQRKPADMSSASVSESQDLAVYESGDVVMFRWKVQWWPGIVVDVEEDCVFVRFAHTTMFT